tara:strand:- start:109 stop:288 length:180 start_codon:yes stop_codon:yes gene_type:complete
MRSPLTFGPRLSGVRPYVKALAQTSSKFVKNVPQFLATAERQNSGDASGDIQVVDHCGA